MKWHRVNKKLPKRTDFYLVSDGYGTYSVAIFLKAQKIFIDRNNSNPIHNDKIRYWSKISDTPCEGLNIPNVYLH